MATITIGIETEEENCWSYEVRVTQDEQPYDYRVALSWSDYDLWCHGRVAPERVVRAALEFLLSKEPASSILPKFDCSLIRRYFPAVDKELPRLL